VFYDRFTQTTAGVERKWLYIPIWIAHKMLPWLIFNPYYHHREGPAVVGDGSFRAVNMGDDECGVPSVGVGAKIIAVEYIAPPPVVDEEELKRLHSAKVKYFVNSMDLWSVSVVLTRAFVRRAWMGALEFVIGEKRNGGKKTKAGVENEGIKVKATYRVHVSIPVSEKPFGKGDLLVLNIVKDSAVGLHKSALVCI
jgi:hypothetical protein